jgi:Spy/CpxP family protein refolding chaperone
MKSKRLLQIAFALLTISGAANFTANSQPTTNRPAQPPGQGIYLAGIGAIGNVLTDEQRASFRQQMESQREQMRGIEVKLREARAKAVDAAFQRPLNETAVRESAMAVASLEADLAVIRAKALAQIQPPLSPEQIEKIKRGIAGAPLRREFRNPERAQPQLAPERQHNITSTNRDENDLPAKQ